MANELTVGKRIQLKQLVDRELDQLYKRAVELGVMMGELFLDNRSQLRNIETVAAAATRTSALKNHVKNQTGKDRLRRPENQTWARGERSLGARTLNLLDELGAHAASIVQRAAVDGTDDERAELARTVEIELQRGVVQTAVCAALYSDPGAQS